MVDHMSTDESGDLPLVDGVRLSKLMVQQGICSRREADAFIAAGDVMVNGVVVDVLGTRVAADSVVTLSHDAQQTQQELLTVIMNKPVGYVSTQPEPGYRPAIDLVHPDNEYPEDSGILHRKHLRSLAAAGRLDIDSHGLLVLTQDGRLASQIIAAESLVEKEYLVRITGELSASSLRLLNHGLSLDDTPLKPALVEWANEAQIRFVLREGRKRQIRRMCDAVGVKVVDLKRVRIGEIRLGNLPNGCWRFLRPGEGPLPDPTGSAGSSGSSGSGAGQQDLG
jgi:23S rRNA pseudouridine2604 synthase